MRAEIPKVPPPPPSDPVTLATPTKVAPPAVAGSSRTAVRLGLAAAIVILSAILAWVMTRPSRQAPAVTAESSTSTPPPVPAPAPADIPLPPSETPAPAPAAGSQPGATVTPAAGVGTTPSSSTAAGGAPGGATDPNAPSAARTGGAPATSPRGAAAATARGRGARGTVVDPPLDFKDVRLLVVVGTKAEEQPGVLNFGGGRVAVVGGESGATLVSIPYSELSYAYYTRAKDPKWSPVLAAPPGNVNLPGGLFSPARHWLTLQSRSSFLIARLSDASWRQILQTVTARTGLEVEHPGALQ